MRILHVIPAVAARYGGPSAAVVSMCRWSAALGIDATIATTNADGEGRLPVRLEAMTMLEGVPAIFFEREWSEAFKVSRPLAGWMRGHVTEFDVIHIHSVFSHSSVAAGGAARRLGIPYVIRPLGQLDPWSLERKPVRKKIAWWTFARKLLRNASAVHYTTDEERMAAEGGLGLTGGVVIPLGTDPSNTDLGSEDHFRSLFPELREFPYLLFLGRLHPKKRLETLLDAFAGLAKLDLFPDLRLVVAGDGDPAYVRDLRARLRGCQGENRVIFSGWLGGNAKNSALRGALLFVLPSAQENFGLAVLEAMAMSVPVLIASAVNLASQVSSARAGWVIEGPVDTGTLQAAMAGALSNRIELRQRGDAGRRCVLEKYLWPDIARRLRELYSDLLPSRTRYPLPEPE